MSKINKVMEVGEDDSSDSSSSSASEGYPELNRADSSEVDSSSDGSSEGNPCEPRIEKHSLLFGLNLSSDLSEYELNVDIDYLEMAYEQQAANLDEFECILEESVLRLTQVTLGAGVKPEDNNIVELEIAMENGDKARYVIANLHPSVQLMSPLDLELAVNSRTKLKFILTKGSGPISLLGHHVIQTCFSDSEEGDGEEDEISDTEYQDMIEEGSQALPSEHECQGFFTKISSKEDREDDNEDVDVEGMPDTEEHKPTVTTKQRKMKGNMEVKKGADKSKSKSGKKAKAERDMETRESRKSLKTSGKKSGASDKKDTPIDNVKESNKMKEGDKVKNGNKKRKASAEMMETSEEEVEVRCDTDSPATSGPGSVSKSAAKKRKVAKSDKANKDNFLSKLHKAQKIMEKHAKSIRKGDTEIEKVKFEQSTDSDEEVSEIDDELLKLRSFQYESMFDRKLREHYLKTLCKKRQAIKLQRELVESCPPAEVDLKSQTDRVKEFRRKKEKATKMKGKMEKNAVDRKMKSQEDKDD